MRAKVAAVIGGLVIAAVGFGVGLPMANANPVGGGQCNNYGNGNVIVAPFCGAQGLVPASATTTPAHSTTTTLPTLPPYTPITPITPIRTTPSGPPHTEQCPPYCGPGGFPSLPAVPPL